MTAIIDAAPTFPCVARGKAPLTAHGFKDATTNTDRISAWRRRWPDANWAIPTGTASGFDVLDVDVRATGNGWSALERLRRAGLLAGAVATVRTPSGGLHIYFPARGFASGSVAGAFLDFKADGGYVLVPPSYVVDDAKGYEGPYEVLDARDIGEGQALDWHACVDLLSPRHHPAPTPGRGKADVRHLADWLRRQGQGNRNKALFWATCRAIETGAGGTDVLEAAAVGAGLPEREAQRTIESARKRLGAKP